MKQLLSYIKLLCISLPFITFAQQDWQLPSELAGNIDSAVYVPSLEMTAFISGSTVVYAGGNSEPFVASLDDYGGLGALSTTTAAVKWDSDNVMLFNDVTFAMFDTNSASINFQGDFQDLPSGIDAAVEWSSSQLLFFIDENYVIYDKDDNSFTEVSPISDFTGWELGAAPDAVLNIKDGFIYFFSGNKYQSLNIETLSFSGGVSTFSSASGPPVVKRSSGPPVVSSNVSSSSGPPISSASQNIAVVKTSNQNTVDTSSWCLTGTPSGDFDSQIMSSVTEIGGGTSGEAYEDKVEAGMRVTEIRVWGSYVIVGMQTVLQDDNGKMIELPILGEKKGRTNTFTLPEGDCIIGVKGTYLGDYGDFVHGMTFITDSGNSKIFGARGRKQFEVKIPDGTSFYGFSVLFNQHISGIGLKFVGYEEQIPPEVSEEELAAAAQKEKQDSYLDKYKGEYDDNHEDYIVELIGMQFGAADGQRLELPAVEWLGLGVDYLYLDPLDIGGSPTKERPLVLIPSKKTGGQEGKKQIPHGTDYKTIGGGSEHSYKSWVESYSDFTTNFGVGMSVSVGTPVGGGSLSGSYKQMNNTKMGSEEIYFTQTVERNLFNLNMDLTWRDRTTGKKSRQKLDFDFRDKIDELPVTGSIPNINANQMTKGKPLPAAIDRISSDYEAIIREYGTHFIGNVNFGGKYVAATRITKQDYEATRETEIAFKASANAKIKAVDIGGDVSFDYGTKNITGRKSGNLTTNKYVQGGSGETKFDTWNTSLKDRPVPIKVKLIPTYELLTKIFWPKDKDIERKQKILKLVTEKYLVDNGLKPKNPDGTFFTDPKAINYKYTMTVTGIKCTGMNNYKVGKEADVYGSMWAGYDAGNTLPSNFWSTSRTGSVGIAKGGMEAMTHKVEVNLPGDKLTGAFVIGGEFKESLEDGFLGGVIGAIGTEISGDEMRYGRREKRIPIKEITDEPKTYSVTGFNYDGIQLEIEVSVMRTPDYAKSKADAKEGGQ